MRPVARAAVLGLVRLGVVGALVMRAQRSEPATSAASTARGARLVELGSTSCLSCKAMHKELALLREECGASIFLDADGRELDRHPYGIMSTPAIVTDERVVHAGGIPTKEEVRQWVLALQA